jgi:cell division septum initiation protein DivIVA
MSAYRVIDKLEIVVREGVWMPFGWRAVNADQVLDLIEKLRSTLPEDAARVRKHVDPAERGTLGKANAADAADVNGQTSSSAAAGSAAAQGADIVARAQARADTIIADAQNAARDIRRGADEYADHVLISLDATLGKTLATVQKGRQALASSATSSNGKNAHEMSSL